MFVAGRYTAKILPVVALLLWLSGVLIGGTSENVTYSTPFFGLSFPTGLLGSLCSIPLYLAVAYTLNTLVVLESRTPWLASLFLCLSSICFFLHGNLLLAFSLLLFMFSITALSTCDACDGVERRVCAIFLLLAFSILMFPQFLSLVPIFFIYLFITRIFRIKTFFAALLGFVTPLWLLFGTEYVFPELAIITTPICRGVADFFAVRQGNPPTMAQLLFIIVELLLMIQSIYFLLVTSNPAKPVMRRMLSLFVITNIYLWIVSLFFLRDFSMFLAWRLPGMALMYAYVVTVKVSKLSNIYFVILNMLLLTIAFLGLWNG